MNHTPLTRRDLLHIGTLGAANLTLASMLRQEAVAAPKRPKVKSVILLQHYGAPSHIDLWDPKPDAPDEIRGEFGVIPTSLPGYRVTEIMPNIARLCDRFTYIRSMTHNVANHNPATYLSITGYTPERDVVQTPATPADHPAFGSAVTKLLADSGAKVPPFVQIPHVVFDQVFKCPGQWAGLLGKRYDPLIVVGNPNDAKYRVDELSLPGDMSLSRLDDRRQLMSDLDAQIRRREVALEHKGVDAFYQRAFSILTSAQTKAAFDLNREPAALRDRYGRNKVGQSYLLSRRLIEAGVRFVTCFNGTDPSNGWDTHVNNFNQLKRKLAPPDDQAFSALIEDMEARGLLDETLVIWAGEFGRNPRIGKRGPTNNIGPGGRDHWPPCYTIVLCGAGLKRGYLHGSSDRIAAYPQDKPVTPADFAATLYWSLGIDPHTDIHDPLGRPIALTKGSPVRELFV